MGILAASESKITFGVDGLFKYEVFGQELWITNTHVSLLLVVLTLTILSLFAKSGANILTINQNIPIDGVANITITFESVGDVQQIVAGAKGINGVKKAELISKG